MTTQMTKTHLITWNCQGLQNPKKLLSFLTKYFLNNNKESFTVCCFQELKTESISNKVKRVLDFYKLSFHFQPAVGKSGGLLTVWNKNEKSDLLFSNDAIMVTKFVDMNLLVCNTYVKTAKYVESVAFINDAFEFLKNEDEKTVMLMGDFNAFCNLKEDRKGPMLRGTIQKDHHIQIFKKLKPTLDNLFMEDIGSYMNVKDHTHKCEKTQTTTRIDYIFCNKTEGIEDFKVHQRDLSDHSVVQITLQQSHEIERGPGQWRLNNNILEVNRKVIHQHLVESMTDKNYDANKQKLRQTLRNICITRSLLNKLYKQNLESELQATNDEDTRMKLQMQLTEINNKQCQELLLTINKSVNEVCEGTPREVKKWAEKCRSSTLITELKTANGNILQDSHMILKEMVNFYGSMYRNENVDNMERFEILRLVRMKIDEDKVDDLEANFTIQEVIDAIMKLRPKTSPGPDGLTTELYQNHSKAFAQILLPIFNDALSGKELPKSFRNATIKFLPKLDGLKEAGDFRPISLINCDQKILAHLITNRLKRVVAETIHRDQFAYLPKRSIHTALEDLLMRWGELDENWCLVSLDFSKAFDRVDRKFLMQLLRKMNIPPNLVRLIEKIYSKTTAQLNVNGFLSKEFRTERGVRQGCPLSALLFIIFLEPLLNILRSNDWEAEPTDRRIISYADDVCFCQQEGSGVVVRSYRKILPRYTVQSKQGQKCSFNFSFHRWVQMHKRY